MCSRARIKGQSPVSLPRKGDKAGLQLAIVIDDATSIEAIGNQLSDIKNFITAQPKVDLNRSVLRQQRRRASHFTIQRR